MKKFIYDFNHIKSGDKDEIFLYGAGAMGKEAYKKIKNKSASTQIKFIDDYVDEIFGEKTVTWNSLSDEQKRNTILTNRFLSEQTELSEVPIYVGDLPKGQAAAKNKIDFLAVGKIIEKLSDNLSSRIYSAVIKLRSIDAKELAFQELHDILKFNPYGKQYTEYLPDKLGYVIDAGFYDGYSSAQIVGDRSYQKIYGFDPADKILHICCRELRITKVKVALFSRSGSGQFLFDESAPTESKLSKLDNFFEAQKLTAVEMISLDDYFSAGIPSNSVIKTDLEGADFDAILGGQNIILKSRPWIAVSIYHSSEDLTRIPLYLMSHLIDYSFYVRHYSFSFNETILYCVPNEGAKDK
jgi:FkbM family methyltransferase